MNFDPLFEDLEAFFSAEESGPREGFSIEGLVQATSIELVLQNGQRQTLIAPVLGQGFVGGVVPDSANWLAMPLEAIRSMGFGFDQTLDLPTLQFSEANLQKYLKQLPMPAACSFLTQNSDEGLVFSTLLGVDYGFLFMQRTGSPVLQAMPLAQVTQLRISAVDNFSKEF